MSVGMASGSGLEVQDSLRFAVALGQSCSQYMSLKNTTSRPLAFKIKTTNPKRCSPCAQLVARRVSKRCEAKECAR